MALGPDRIHTEDTPSETVRLTRRLLNELLLVVDGMFEAAATAVNGDDFRTAVALLDLTSLRQIRTTIERPAPPQIPTTGS